MACRAPSPVPALPQIALSQVPAAPLSGPELRGVRCPHSRLGPRPRPPRPRPRPERTQVTTKRHPQYPQCGCHTCGQAPPWPRREGGGTPPRALPGQVARAFGRCGVSIPGFTPPPLGSSSSCLSPHSLSVCLLPGRLRRDRQVMEKKLKGKYREM